jgi:PAS domain S-box-containing protein
MIENRSLPAQTDGLATQEISDARLSDLESSEMLLKVIAENVADLIAVVDSGGKRIWNNTAYAVRLGYQPEDLRGSDSMVEIHPDDHALVRETLAESVREGRGRRIEYRMRRKDGGWIVLESEGRVVRDWNGHECCLVVVSRDITARKQEEEKREERSRLRVKRALALTELISSRDMQDGEAAKCFATAVRIVIEASSFNGASIWTMDEKEEVLTCRQRSGTKPEQMPVFTILEHEAFFGLLKNQRVIASKSIAEDARLGGIARVFSAEGVTGLQIIPLWRGCAVLGALFCERSGAPRNWDYEESAFATSCAHAVVLAIDTRERLNTYQRLQESQQQLSGELRHAAAYVESLLPARMQGEVETDWRFIPSEALGGDAFGYYWLDPDHFAIYLLDVVDHGVRAALVSVAVMNHLRRSSLPAADLLEPAKVLTTLNKFFQMDEQDGMYFTLWYGVYDKSQRQIRYASAGHPPALLFARGSAEPLQLRTPGLMIGAMPDAEYAANSCAVEPGSTLYVISDGVYEIELPSGATATLGDLIQNMSTFPDDNLDRVVASAQAMRRPDRTAFDDDFSILKLTFR